MKTCVPTVIVPVRPFVLLFGIFAVHRSLVRQRDGWLLRHHQLTSLPNSLGLRERVADLRGDPGPGLAVLYLDLDGVRRMSRQIRLEQSFGKQDRDGWESRLVDLVRDKGFSRTRKGTGYKYGSTVTRTEVLNARDASPPGATIRIRAVAHAAPPTDLFAREINSGRGVLVQVSDAGAGITPELVGRLFEPYFTTKGTKGTGLGLTSIRTYLRSIGGDVACASIPGEGATFSMWIPAQDAGSRIPSVSGAFA